MKEEYRNAVLNSTPVTVCLLDNNKVLTLLNSYRQVCLPPPYPTFLLRPSAKRDKSTRVHINLLDIIKRRLVSSFNISVSLYSGSYKISHSLG